MGVYIPGMEMPTSCAECVFKSVTGVDRWKCHALKAEFMSWSVGWGGEETRRIDCPLVPVPEHGRLGDLDALHKLFLDKGKEYKGVGGAMLGAAAWCIANAPTIIPADKEGEG